MSRAVSAAALVVVFSLTCGAAYGQTNLQSTAAQEAGRAFPADARLAYVDVDRVASISAEGRAASARLEALRAKKSAELAAMSKALDDLQTKLNATATVIADGARARLQWDVQRAQLNFRRASEDAQTDLQQAQQETLQAFTAKVFPIIAEVAKEKRVWAVFGSDSGLVWHDPATDLTDEVAKRLDASAKRP